jgi:transposase-like protein
MAFPPTLPQFQKSFPDDATRRAYLVAARWPNGFVCGYCGGSEAWSRSREQLICTSCRHLVSVTSGTILDHTRLSLENWFWAAYLMVTRPGLNSVTLAAHLGLSSRETAHAILARLRRAMAAAPLPQLSGVVEVDEMITGAPVATARGWQTAGTKKKLILVAVERGTTRTRMALIADRKGPAMVQVLLRHVAPGSTIVTDGHRGYMALPAAGFTWQRIPHPAGGLKRGGKGRATPAVDGQMSYFRRWLLATYNKPPANYEPYLAEFNFRSEYRHRPAEAFPALMELAVRAA